jgi:hypothetical protein
MSYRGEDDAMTSQTSDVGVTEFDDMMVQRFLENFGRHDTNELLAIWKENDRRGIGKERIEAIRQILLKRGCELPPQDEFIANAPICAFQDSEYYVAFLGGNDEYYLPRFKKFSDGGNKFSFTWNWAAFFLQNGWLLYRKMYLWFAIAFLPSLIPFAGLLFGVFWALAGNYLYFRKATNTIQKTRSSDPENPDLTQRIAKRGGVNMWVAIVVAVLWLLSIIATFAGM